MTGKTGKRTTSMTGRWSIGKVGIPHPQWPMASEIGVERAQAGTAIVFSIDRPLGNPPVTHSTSALGQRLRDRLADLIGGDRPVSALGLCHAQGVVGRIKQSVDAAGAARVFGHADRHR
jgi:hypothetical protein